MVINDLVQQNFAPAIGLAFTLLFLVFNSTLPRKYHRIFFYAFGLCVLELVAANQENYFGTVYTVPTVRRILWSAIGYTVRPIILYLMLALTAETDLSNSHFRRWGLLLVVNAMLAFSAFVSGIAYNFDETNHFGRGPLGYMFFVVLVIYLLLILYSLFKKRHEYSGFRQTIGFACIVVVCMAMACELLFSGIGLSRTAMTYSLLAYLMYYQSAEYQKEHVATTYVAEHDGLTGLLNRYAYERKTEHLTGSDQPLGYLILDIDSFKSINDTYGHETGDKALQKVAELLKEQFRSDDYVVRLGGDEFVALMPGLTTEQIPLIQKRVSAINSVLLDTNATGLPAMSVSAGAAFSQKGFSEALYQKADKALYQTKNTTRCGVTIDEEL